VKRFIIMSIAFALMCAAVPGSAFAESKTDDPLSWDLPKPTGYEPSVDEPPYGAGSLGTGYNAIPFGAFETGDMIVARDVLSVGHAGMWDDSKFQDANSMCVLSANVTPRNGVQYEKALKYRCYDWAWGLWVPSAYGARIAAKNWCALQMGEPYNLFSSKTDFSRWYCSKLPWAGWLVKGYVDLDWNGGTWVAPTDLVLDGQTKVFARGY
jgi:hypothetical protein